MSDFAIVTDTAAELLEELSVKLDIHMIPMEFTMSGVSYQHDAGYRQMDAKTFYRRLRDGEMATTSAINPGQYVEYLTPILAGGQDVLLLVFSSGLSSTYQNSLLAAEELRAQFPDRKLYVVDTLAPSGGQALLVYHAALRRQEGASLEETRDWVEENKLHLAHWFTVDDLMFLKRGGRISAATAVMGSMLSIKPVLHVDDAGHLVNVSKARGRRASLRALVDKMEQTAIHPENQTVFIGHGDCLEDAQWVAEEVRRRFGTRSIYIAYTCPVRWPCSFWLSIGNMLISNHRTEFILCSKNICLSFWFPWSP